MAVVYLKHCIDDNVVRRCRAEKTKAPDCAWQVACSAVQLPPLEESPKYELLGMDALVELIGEPGGILDRPSGED